MVLDREVTEEWVAFKVDQQYGLVLAAMFAIVVVYIFAVAGAGSKRGALFTQEWMEENFGKEHEEATGEKIGKGGYPDCGNGRYTHKRGYKDWVEFNRDQRVHLNFMENIL